MANEKEVKPKVELTIAQVKQDLKDGLDRPAIAKKYGIRRVDVMTLFTNPELKGLKVHRPRGASSKSKATIGFILKDDNGNDITSTVFPAAGVNDGATTNGPATNTAEHAPAHKEAHKEAVASADSNW